MDLLSTGYAKKGIFEFCFNCGMRQTDNSSGEIFKGAGVGVGVGVGVEVGVGVGFFTATPLFQSNFLPDLMQV